MRYIRKVIRYILGVRESETIKDSIDRKRTKFLRLLYRKKYGVDDLKMAIQNCGIEENDIVLVHSSWRQFFNFQGSPDDVIDVLMDVVGLQGTILMPSFGKDKTFFDVDNTASCAGVITEVFRKRVGVKRSECAHFSVASWGKSTDELIGDHSKSVYGFDEFSPCFKLTKHNNAKILFLGLGKKPAKVSLFHCAGWFMKNKDNRLCRLYGYSYDSTVISNGYENHRSMVDRLSGHGNKDQMFSNTISNAISYKKTRISNLDVVSIGATDGFETAIKAIKKGRYFYKRMDAL